MHENDPVVFGAPFRQYHHHMTQIWYENDMAPGSDFQICRDREGEDCSLARFNPEKRVYPDCPLRLGCHTHYFKHHVSTYGINGCVGNETAEAFNGKADWYS